MAKRTKTALLVWLALSATPALCQEARVRPTEVRADVADPEEERGRALRERLKSIKLSLAGCGEDLKTYAALSSTYKDASNLCIRLVFTNTSAEKVHYSLSNTRHQARPQLFKDGEEVPYRREMADLVNRKDRRFFSIRSIPVGLESNEFKSVLVNLGDWYEPLRAGQYRLVVKWQHYPGADWAEAPPVEFGVEPK